MIARLFIFICLAGGILGCASARFGDYYQKVPVTSQPSGARILVDGRDVGVTPQYLDLRRGRKFDLQLRYPDGRMQPVGLTQNYRWLPSFWGNFIFTIFAPVGWGVDLLSGAAYDFANVKAVESGRHAQPATEPRGHFVVAPPTASSDFLSADLGRNLEAQVRAEFPKAQVSPFDDTVVAFYSAHWRHDNVPREESQNDLLDDLKANYFFESVVDETVTPMIVHWELKDSFSKDIVRRGSLRVSQQELATVKNRTWVERLGERFRFLPDLAMVDFGATSTTVQINNRDPGKGHAVGGGGFLGDAFKYLGAINIGVATPSISRAGWTWDFAFVPSFQLLLLNEEFDDPALKDIHFERTRASAGYGPRLGVNTRYGYFYGSLIPMVGWTRVQARRGGANGQAEAGTFNLATELGYSQFVSDRINLRLFVKTVSENEDLWRKATSSLLNQPLNFTSISYASAGISLGYYFPEVKNWVHHK